MDQQAIKENLKSSNTWIRGLFILLFAFIWGVAEMVAGVVVIFQFVYLLVNAKLNDHLLKLGKELASFCYQIMLYVTFNANEKPYPFADWPKIP